MSALRVVAVAFLFTTFHVQDQEARIAELVKNLDSADIAEREKATAALIKLGPAAITALRGHHAKSGGEVRLRIEAVLVKLEQAERIAHHLKPGPVITLKAKDRPADEVLDEVSKQSGVRVDGSGLPPETLLTLDVERLSLPATLDKLCEIHGKILPRWAANKVRLVPGTYRPRRHFEVGPYRFIPEGFGWAMTRGAPANHAGLRFYGLLIGPPGRIPHEVSIAFEDLADDKGNNLAATGRPGGFELAVVEWPDPARFCRLVDRISFGADLDPEASRLTRCRGYLRVVFIEESRKLASEKAGVSSEPDFPEGKTTLKVSIWHRDGRSLRASFWANHRTDFEKDEPLGPLWIAVHDKNGRRSDGRTTTGATLVSSGDESCTESTDGTATFLLPEGFEPETIDVMEGTRVEEIRIPFDLGEVPLR